MNKLFFFLFVPLIAVPILYDGFAVAGIGLSSFLLLGCATYAILHGLNRQSGNVGSFFRKKSVRNVFFLYVLFVLGCFISHVANGSTTVSDYQYLASLAGQALWFPVCWYTVQRAEYSFEQVVKAAVVLVFAVTTVFWMLGVVQYADPFFLRSVGSPFGGVPMAPHFFENANRSARFFMILLMFTSYFSYISTSRSSKYWKFMTYVLYALTFLTLSRSGIAGMMTFLVITILIQKRASKRIAYFSAIGVIAFCAVILTPGVSDRIEQAVSTITSFDTGIQTSELDNSITIRARSWRASYQIIGDNPVFGVGSSSALSEMGDYGALAWKGGDEVQAIWVHGGFLKIGLYAGLVGLITFFLFVYTLGKTFYSNYLSFRTVESRQKYAAIVGLAGLVASIPVNIGADFYTIGLVWFTFAYLLVSSSLRR